MTTQVAEIQPRRGTAAQWAAADRVLLLGEEGWDTDARKHKKGDGTRPWSALPFVEDTLAPLASPAFTGNPTAPTQADADNSTRLATTEFVKRIIVVSEAPSATRAVRALGAGADDTPQIVAATNGVVADGRADGTDVGKVLFDTRGGDFQMKGAFDLSQAGNSQWALPLEPAATHATRKFTLELDGPTSVTALPHWNQTVGQRQGAVLYTSAVGTNDNVNGPPSVMGGPTVERGYGGGSGDLWSNLCVVINGLMVVAPAVNPTMSGFNLEGVLEAKIGPKGAAYMVDASPAAMDALISGGWTNQWTYGLRMPTTDNNDLCIVDDWSSEGVWYPIVIGEHTHVRDMRSVYCGWGIMLDNRTSTPHWAQIDYASVELCANTMGVLTGAGEVKVNIGMLDLEGGSFIWDGNSLIIGDIRVGANEAPGKFDWNAGGLGSWIGNWASTPTNGRFMRITSPDSLPGAPANQPAVPAASADFWNKSLRDGFVMVAGGTGVAISVDGLATGLAAGTVPVPAGKKINLGGYTVAPAWKWMLL